MTEKPSSSKPGLWVVSFVMESESPKTLLHDLASLGLTETGVAVNQHGKVVVWNGNTFRPLARAKAARALKTASAYISKAGKVVRLPVRGTKEWWK